MPPRALQALARVQLAGPRWPSGFSLLRAAVRREGTSRSPLPLPPPILPGGGGSRGRAGAALAEP